jgi:hypothetical protein
MDGESTQQGHGRSAPETGSSTLPLTPGRPIALHVENPNGSVTVRATERQDVLVRWTKHGKRDSVRYEEATVETSVDDHRVRVGVRLPASWGGGDLGRVVRKLLDGGHVKVDAQIFAFGALLTGDVRFDLTVELPRSSLGPEATVKVRTASGDVRVEEVAGTLDVATASGEVALAGGDGEATIHAVSGDLTVQRAQGGVTARTASGGVRITGGRLTRFALTTVSGDVTVEAALAGDETSRVDSVSGDVRLALDVPAATGASLSLKSIAGDARVASEFRGVGRRAWRLGPGETGGPAILVKTVSGNLEARGTLSGEAPPVPPAERPTAPAAGSVGERPAGDEKTEARLAVLRAVERGELEVEEALSRLESLGQAG